MGRKLHDGKDGVYPLLSLVVAQYSVMPLLHKAFGQNMLLNDLTNKEYDFLISHATEDKDQIM